MKDSKDVFTVDFVTAYSPKLVVGLDCSVEPSQTKQSFASECDVNNIMARYERTGILDFVNEHEPHYGEASAFDFQVASNLVIDAQRMFDDLPANIRSRFQNDPVQFLLFIDDPLMVDESIKLGLRTAPVLPSDTSPLPPVSSAPAIALPAAPAAPVTPS